MQLADDILAAGYRRDAIVEHRGRPLLANHRSVAALALHLLHNSVEPYQPPLVRTGSVHVQYRFGTLGPDYLPLGRLRRWRQVEVVALESVDARRRAGCERGGVDHRQRREDRVMLVEAHAL